MFLSILIGEDMENPFLPIVADKDQKLIGKKLEDSKNLIKEIKNQKRLIIILGEYGSGKSLFVDAIKDTFSKQFKVTELVCYLDILDQLNKIAETKGKKSLIIIDKLELCIDNEIFKQLVEKIKELFSKGNYIILTSTPETKKDIEKAFGDINEKILYLVPNLDFEETKELVINRLNSIQKNKAIRSLYPFTEKEIKEIWSKSKGNPRLILMLCASLYESKHKE